MQHGTTVIAFLRGPRRLRHRADRGAEPALTVPPGLGSRRCVPAAVLIASAALAFAATAQVCGVGEWVCHRSADGLHPDGLEQELIWLMNRARQDPLGEGAFLARLGGSGGAGRAYDFFDVDLGVLQEEFAAHRADAAGRLRPAPVHRGRRARRADDRERRPGSGLRERRAAALPARARRGRRLLLRRRRSARQRLGFAPDPALRPRGVEQRTGGRSSIRRFRPACSRAASTAAR